MPCGKLLLCDLWWASWSFLFINIFISLFDLSNTCDFPYWRGQFHKLNLKCKYSTVLNSGKMFFSWLPVKFLTAIIIIIIFIINSAMSRACFIGEPSHLARIPFTPNLYVRRIVVWVFSHIECVYPFKSRTFQLNLSQVLKIQYCTAAPILLYFITQKT